ncbi:hypothetical protein NIASO_03520 [Niabella soli DSM 19437]|uniref:Uncharacterized protein n=1 Tax=Niabella soli DSM 19437 TaxID=929713 RepID=W0F6Y7_9BACT|nr:hypothetical protein NIASO_03520 [Niabella soli DSM 19437]
MIDIFLDSIEKIAGRHTMLNTNMKSGLSSYNS